MAEELSNCRRAGRECATVPSMARLMLADNDDSLSLYLRPFLFLLLPGQSSAL